MNEEFLTKRKRLYEILKAEGLSPNLKKWRKLFISWIQNMILKWIIIYIKKSDMTD